MIESMAQLQVTEAEVARDLHELLTKVQHGIEFVIEHHRPVAVIRSPLPKVDYAPSALHQRKPAA